jgi:ABC-type sugar transport system ATPase subunit
MIRVSQLCVSVGAFALRDIAFEIPTGAYAVLMGKTGSGKTTLLEILCGLRRADSGRIWLDETEVTRLDPALRGIGYVPQDRALFQTMTVGANIAFGMAVHRFSKAKASARLQELADLLGITHLLPRYPQGLSGGEAQRVALGRALAIEPHFLCLDEPLSALDEDTRSEMYDLLQSVRMRTGVTTLHVTHHPGEAERLADLVLRLEDGQVRVAKKASP